MTETRTQAPVNTPIPEPTNAELGLAPARPQAGASVAPGRRRRHTGRRIVRGLATVGLVALAVGGVAYVATPTHASAGGWAEAGVEAVSVDLSRGDVQITESTDGLVHWSEDLKYKGDEYKTTHHMDGKTLVIATDHARVRWAFNWADKLEYKLALPKGTAITYHQSAGKTDLAGEFGAVNIDMSAGELRASKLTASSLGVKMSAGNIALSSVTTPALNLEQSAGNSNVKFDAAPARVTVKSSAGNVDMWLPGSSIYKVTEQHSAGNVKINVPTSSSASDHTVDIDVSAGNVSLRQA